MTIRYGFHPTPFGGCLLGMTERGVCALEFVTASRQAALRELRDEWPAAEFVKDDDGTGEICRHVFRATSQDSRAPFHLHLRGTNFQLKVWQALLAIPSGCVTSYGDLAAKINAPNAQRAVGSAVGRNPISYLIPCHRVIQGLGVFGNYGGGPVRKQAMIGWEAVRMASQ